MMPTVTLRMARTALFCGALAHGALSLLLWSHGLQPSATWLPAAWHYLVQAVLAVPVYWLQWHVLSRVVAKLLVANRHRVYPMCGWVLGNCTLGLLVVPDSVLYFYGGAEALRWGAPWVLSTLFLGSWFWLSLRLRRAFAKAPTPRIVVAALLGLVAQALVGAVILR